MIESLITEVVTNPLWNEGYAFWSGIGSDVFLITGLAAWWHHINCIESGCWRKGHKSPEHGGHPICKIHSKHPALKEWT